MTVVKEIANAKINLYLDVVSKRQDDFHDIKTVMHSVSLCDLITVSYTPSKKTNVTLTVRGNNFIPTDGKNLAVKAAMIYLERASLNADIAITLEKNIPVAAGLAGGSADAAAVLRALNKIFDKMFTHSALSGIAAELGSDVPYCLYGKTALCEGRGEIITKLPDTLDLHTVIAIANEHISTPQAYGELDRLYSDFDGSIKSDSDNRFESLISAIPNGGLGNAPLFNIFESAVLPSCSGALKIKELLQNSGADYTLMSGSGPSVFGVFASEEEAKGAISVLKEHNITAHYAKSI